MTTGTSGPLGGAEPRWTDHRLGRRGIVVGGAVLLSTTALRTTPAGRQVLDALVSPRAAALAGSNVRVERLRRASDQLVVDVVLVGLEVVQGQDRTSYLDPGDQTGYVGFVLPGQSIGESTAHSLTWTPSAPMTKTEVAVPSLLAFDVPPGTTLEFSLAGLLEWGALKARWEGVTGDANRRTTRIEAPFRLQLHPNDNLTWLHDREPRRLGETGTVELWHTRLAGKDAEGEPDPRITRFKDTHVVKKLDTTLPTPLEPIDRSRIAALASSKPAVAGARPVAVTELLLSSLGATLELHGAWPGSANLTTWDHRASLGRDDYVKTVTVGYLAPWGHPAALVDESWRRMKIVDGRSMAVLERVVTIVLRDPVVDTRCDFARKQSDGTYAGLKLPFTSVRCLVRQSPPVVRGVAQLKKSGGVPLVEEGIPLALPFAGRDWSGREAVFSSRVWFVPGAMPSSAASQGWNGEDETFRGVDLRGAQVAVAPEGTGPAGCTTVPLGAAVVRVTLIPYSKLGSRVRAPFRPILSELVAQVPAVQALTGTPAGAKHSYDPAYSKDQANVGGIVLRPANPIAAVIPGELSGGIAQLPAAYQALSTKYGAIVASGEAIVDQVAQGIAKAESIYNGLKLLGSIPLEELVLSQLSPKIAELTQVAKTVTEVVDGRQVVRMHLAPTLKKSYDAGPLKFVPGPLTLDTVVSAGGTGVPQRTVDVRMGASRLQLGGLVMLPINSLRVTSATGAPLDMRLDLGEVEFLGPLGFVQRLSEVLAPLLAAAGADAKAFAGGAVQGAQAAKLTEVALAAAPDVDVDLSGIHLRQDLALPDVALGAFTCVGLGFGLRIDLLFAGGLLVKFNFATHEHPFQLSYGPFGGGGYTALEMSGGKVKELEVSLMVAGAAAINLGVAAGAITASAGFVLAIPSSGPLSITAFFRATGNLSVLGLVNLSAVFELVLDFVPSDPVQLTGTASLSFKVEVLFVSKTVSASVSKTLAGGAKKTGISGRAASTETQADSFADIYPTAVPWGQYAAAFAS